MINWRRPSNKSNRLTLPLGPSNSYFFPTGIHGIRRRSAASASLERVKAFSFTRSCWRAASHSCGDTIGGVFMGHVLSRVPCLSPCFLPSYFSLFSETTWDFLSRCFSCETILRRKLRRRRSAPCLLSRMGTSHHLSVRVAERDC